MVQEVSTGRMIQRCFWDANGNIDVSLSPQGIRGWYENLSDEEDTFDECESDVGYDW